MYTFRGVDPRLTGYIYTRRKRCGKKTCRCAKSDKHRHISYQLQYTDNDGKKRTEYVPKGEVRALRQRIRRTKARNKQLRAEFRDFMSKNDEYLYILSHPEAIEDTGQLITAVKKHARRGSRFFTRTGDHFSLGDLNKVVRALFGLLLVLNKS